ncbi:hypothetical protein SAMN02745148_03128 [Modicisalibacter ilicicola DSM 19980]|uniref:Uncharacterized protein n=1 Tax=Modicisalibacter ilicicola DSM 19980 TaxID=1121942 RepID=A0A1M5D5U4_9GAMM|nr:hypothetical protein [Halomonas ilicicola]SHF62443.1 hypothetical protein SAMN02745148_03128 [Halomonas ilicicola DSM 19980]
MYWHHLDPLEQCKDTTILNAANEVRHFLGGQLTNVCDDHGRGIRYQLGNTFYREMSRVSEKSKTTLLFRIPITFDAQGIKLSRSLASTLKDCTDYQDIFVIYTIRNDGTPCKTIMRWPPSEHLNEFIEDENIDDDKADDIFCLRSLLKATKPGNSAPMVPHLVVKNIDTDTGDAEGNDSELYLFSWQIIDEKPENFCLENCDEFSDQQYTLLEKLLNHDDSKTSDEPKTISNILDIEKQKINERLEENRDCTTANKTKHIIVNATSVYCQEIDKKSSDNGKGTQNTNSIDRINALSYRPRLLFPRHEIRQLSNGIQLLCQKKKRERISAEHLFRLIGKSAKEGEGKVFDDQNNCHVELSNLYITSKEAIRFVHRLDLSLTLIDVKFAGDVVLDNCIITGSIMFRSCHFYQGFSAKDATIKGSLTLNDCFIDGGTNVDTPKRLKPALALHGLKIHNSFFADRLRVHGRIRAQWMQIGNIFSARGLRVFPRPEPYDQDAGHSKAVVDFRHTRVSGPMDLSSQVADGGGGSPQENQRTRLQGDCLLSGVKAEVLQMNGVFVKGDLHLMSAQIESAVEFDCISSTDLPHLGWRTQIEGDLEMAYLHCEYINGRGIRVSGDLNLCESEIEHSCHLDIGFRNSARTLIQGNLILDGTRTKGDIDLCGARIKGELRLVSGSCQRLIANVTWRKTQYFHDNSVSQEPEERIQDRLELVPTWVQKDVVLLDCCLGTLSMVGISIDDSITTNNLVVNGRVRFWGSRRKIFLREQIQENLNNEGWSYNALNESIESKMRDIISHVDSIDFRTLYAEGGLNLSKICNSNVREIDNAIMLDNATIKNNLVILTENADDIKTRLIGNITIHEANIEGELDARGLQVISGSFMASNMRVSGAVWLASGNEQSQGDEQELEEPKLEVKKSIVLQGLVAPKLVIDGHSILDHDHPDACIDLSGARINNLVIKNLAPPFPVPLNLQAIQVNNWGIKPEECLTLLHGTHLPGRKSYFDARNYVDIESRLSVIGEIQLANKVYRKMAKQLSTDGSRNLTWRKLIFCLDKAFSLNRTQPLLMFFWLALMTFFSFLFLSDHRNIEEIGADRQELVNTYLQEERWNNWKALGLAVSYAIPFYGGAKYETTRARILGSTCNPFDETDNPNNNNQPLLCRPLCQSGLSLSPHDLAQTISIFQFILWIFLAANLPAIIRRRNT